jgi:hypothetical protein
MDISEKITTAMMQRDIDTDTGGDLLDLALMVQRHMFCQCGDILDFSSSVVLRLGTDPIKALCGKCFDGRKNAIVEKHGSVITWVDGRLYNSKFQLRKKTPPAKPAKPAKQKPRARLNIGDGLQEVEYSKRFEGSGLTWFIHGKKKEWTVTQWECGLRLGVYDTQKQGIAAASNLTPEQVNIARGSISLHKINPPVKEGGK